MIHRANASTGPRTPEGKAISSLNHVTHGLTGGFRLLPNESEAEFVELRNALRSEHAPATPTESILVDRLAEHAWLSARAQRIGDISLVDANVTGVALFLRYRTTHDRAFHKCLAELRLCRRERATLHQPAPAPLPKPAEGKVNQRFESQTAAAGQFESQIRPLSLLPNRFSAKLPAAGFRKAAPAGSYSVDSSNRKPSAAENSGKNASNSEDFSTGRR